MPWRALPHRGALSRVGVWRGGGRFGLSVAAPFVWRCPSNLAVAPFPHPSHRTERALLAHSALGQDIRPSPTESCARAVGAIPVQALRESTLGGDGLFTQAIATRNMGNKNEDGPASLPSASCVLVIDLRRTRRPARRKLERTVSRPRPTAYRIY